MVTDRALIEGQLRTATSADRVWLLRLLGHLEQSASEGEALLAASAAVPRHERIRPLLLVAHTRSWQRAWGRAAELHAEALTLAVDTSREAVVRQHWGKCLFEQERYAEAAEQFRTALRLRQAAGEAADLVESSAIALRRTRELGSLTRFSGHSI